MQSAIASIVHVSWTFVGSGLRGQRHCWLFEAEQGGGWICAHGSHAVDTLRWLLDDKVANSGRR